MKNLKATLARAEETLRQCHKDFRDAESRVREANKYYRAVRILERESREQCNTHDGLINSLTLMVFAAEDRTERHQLIKFLGITRQQEAVIAKLVELGFENPKSTPCQCNKHVNARTEH